MYSRSPASHRPFRYLPEDPPASPIEKQRQEYNHLITRLSQQNNMLARNVKELMVENIQLKSRIIEEKRVERKDYEFGYAYSPEKTEKYDRKYVQDSRRRVIQTDYQKPSRGYIYEGERDSYSDREMQRSRNNKPTIIEDLSESHFRRNQLSSPQNIKRKNMNNTRNVKDSATEGPIKRSLTEKDDKKRQSFEIPEQKSPEQEHEYQHSETKEINVEANPEDNSFRRSGGYTKKKESPNKTKLYKKDNSPYLNPNKQFNGNDPYLSKATPVKKRSYQDYLTEYRRVSPDRSSQYLLYPSP